MNTKPIARAFYVLFGALFLVAGFGALLVFVGLITLWFARHYESSRPFHWAMTASWALHALAHWFDVRGARSPARSSTPSRSPSS